MRVFRERDLERDPEKLFSEREKAFRRSCSRREKAYGEVVLGAGESFLESPGGRPGEVVLGARETFPERPRVKAGEVVLGVRESFPDEPEAAIERRRILPNLLLKSPLIQAVSHYSRITEFKISRTLCSA